jgi:CspA family cold shock protein
MPKATVKWFDLNKGFGFISPDNQEEQDLFVHIMDVKKSGIGMLDKDDVVQYEVKKSQKGFNAVNLVLLDRT